MSTSKGMANITTDEASSKLTMQQLLNQNIVLSMLHIFLSLLEYTNLWDFCHTCKLFCNKYKKYLNYKLNYRYSLMYYTSEKFRTTVLETIAYPEKHLYLNLKCPYNGSVITDSSVFTNIYYLDLSFCKFIDISKIRNVHILNLSNCPYVEDLSTLRDVYVLNLSWCYISNFGALSNIRFLSLRSSCTDDISALGNIDTLDTLDLSFSCNISDLSSLINVRVLDISFCDNIKNFGTLKNVCVLNLSGCNYKNMDCSLSGCNYKNMDCITCKLSKKIPIILSKYFNEILIKNNSEYNEFRKKYFGMFD
jgi:hypothetical protein